MFCEQGTLKLVCMWLDATSNGSRVSTGLLRWVLGLVTPALDVGKTSSLATYRYDRSFQVAQPNYASNITLLPTCDLHGSHTKLADVKGLEPLTTNVRGWCSSN